MSAADPIPLHPSEDDLLEARVTASRDLIAAGFAVLPLWSTEIDGTCRCRKGAGCDQKPGKHPWTSGPGETWHVTHDPVAAETMLRAGSLPNLGVFPPVGVFAWDVDEDVPAKLERLSADLGPLPATYGHVTRNGRHRFHRWPAAIDRPTGQLFDIVTRWPNVDHGRGYVVGPYSRIGEYVYRPEGSPSAISTLPDAWALAASRQDQARQRPTVDEITPGQRHVELRDLAYALHKRGLSGKALRAAVDEVNAALPQPKTPAEVSRAIGDVERFPVDDDVPAAVDPTTWPAPEDRGTAVLSPLGGVEYVEDIVRPGRITLVAAEEGSGKSYAITGELAIRISVAGGSFAGTWPILRNGPALVLSEMHADDDFEREEIILGSLGLGRSALAGCYFRLPLPTAAGGPPALTVPPWRQWVTGWLRDHGALVLVVDTATTATQVDPWGKAIQQVYADLRMMLAEYPDLAIILVVHLKKPIGRGGRRLSDVLGEWGRWDDITILIESDGPTRSKVSTHKRVRKLRRLAVTKSGGLLVDPVDIGEEKGAKVPADDVVAAVVASPGITYEDLGAVLGVSKDTASRYVRGLPERLNVVKGTNRRAALVYPSAAAPQSTAGTGAALIAALPQVGETAQHRSAAPPYKGAAVRAALTTTPPEETFAGRFAGQQAEAWGSLDDDAGYLPGEDDEQ